jgi:flagellar hook-length control protein FliK
MNVSVPTLPDMNSIQQLNTKPDFTQGTNSGDSREFNSLVNKHGSERVDKKAASTEGTKRAKHQDDTVTSRETGRSSEQNDNTKIDNSDKSGKSAESSQSQNQINSYEETANKIKGNDLIGVNRSYKQAEGGFSLEALMSMLDVKAPAQGIDGILNNAASGNVEESGSPDGAVSGEVSEEEAADLLLNALQQAVGAVNNSLQATVSENGKEEPEAAAGSLKKGAALFNLLQKAIAAASDTPESNGNTAVDVEQSPKGMSASNKVQKIETLLTELLNNNSAKIPGGEVADSEGPEVSVENLTAQAKTAGKGDGKSDSFNDIAKMLSDNKTAPVEEKLSAEQIKALHEASGRTKEAKEVTSSSNGKNVTRAGDEFKVVQAPEEASEVDLPESGSDLRIIVNRAASEISEHASRDSNAGEITSRSTRTVKLNPEGSNPNMLHHSHTTGEGGKLSESILTGSAARQSGFNELLDKAVYVAKGNNRLNVSVDHQEIGKIDIKLSLEKGVMNIHINTSDNVVREYVENNIQSIVDSLSKNGVSVGGFSVALKNHQNGGDSPSANDNGYASNSGREKEYIKTPAYANENRGLINIFA